MSKDGNVVIPQSIEEFVENYPDEARRIACRKTIGEYNTVRDEMQSMYGISIVLWMDTNGVVAKTKAILYYLNERGHQSVDN